MAWKKEIEYEGRYWQSLGQGYYVSDIGMMIKIDGDESAAEDLKNAKVTLVFKPDIKE